QGHGHDDAHTADGELVPRDGLGDVVTVSGDQRSESPRDDDPGSTCEVPERRQMQMIVVPVRDEDRVRCDVQEAVGRRSRPAAQRPEAIDEQRVGEDARPIEIDEDGRVAEKSDAAGRHTHLASVPVPFDPTMGVIRRLIGLYRTQAHLLWRWNGGWPAVARRAGLILLSSLAA